MDNVLIYSGLLLHKMYMSFKTKKGGREIDFRLRQSTISYVQEDLGLNLAWGAALDGCDLFLSFHSQNLQCRG